MVQRMPVPIRLALPAFAAASSNQALAGVLEPHGPIAAAEAQLLLVSLGVMLVVVVPVIMLTFVFAWWFRASNKRAIHLPDWEYSGKVEFTVWTIPLLVVLFLAAITWASSHELDPYRPIASPNKRVRVEVVSLDWKWLFIYPELGVASLNELAIPVDTPVSFNLTSGTVMNAIYVPGLAGQIYTMSGMCTQLSLLASNPGVYSGLSTQFSGDGFSDMHFNVIASDQKGFAQWVSKVRDSGSVLDKAAYEKLLAEHASSSTAYYSYAEDGLFDYALQRGTTATSQIMTRTIDPEVGACLDTRATNGVD